MPITLIQVGFPDALSAIPPIPLELRSRLCVYNELVMALANYGHWAKPGPLPVVVNKVLLKQLFSFVKINSLKLLSDTMAELSSDDRNCMAHKA